MKRKLAILLVLVVAAALIKLHVLEPSVAASDSTHSVVFYVLEPTQPLRLTIGASRALKLGVRWRGPLDQSPRALRVVFRSREGAELAREQIVTPAPGSATEAAASWSVPRWTRLVPPEGAATLEVSSDSSGAVVRLLGGREDSLRHGPDFHRMRIDPSLLHHDEAHRLTPLKWTPLPALSEATTTVLPLPDPEERSVANVLANTVPTDLRHHVDGQHSLVLNVKGTGLVKLTARGRGRLQAHVVGGPETQQHALDLQAGTPLAIEVSGSVSSIVIDALDDATADIESAFMGPAPLAQGTGVTRARRALRLRSGQAQSYALDGTAPIRIWACAMRPGSTHTLRWRLLRAGQELGRGELTLPSSIDRLSFLPDAPGQPAVADATIRTLLPEGADELELAATEPVLTGVDTQLSMGADATPIEPFPLAPQGMRWRFVPSRAPAWLALRPRGALPEDAYVTLARTPHLEPVIAAERVETSFVSVMPIGANAVPLVEPSKRPDLDRSTLVRVPGEVSLRVGEHGVRSGRLSATCSALSAKAGSVSLQVDGKLHAERALLAGMTRLSTRVAPGIHRVRVDGPAGSCVFEAAPATGAATVRRSVFEVGDSRPLRLVVDTTSHTAKPIYLALYQVDANRGQLTLRIDGGRPQRRRGAFERLSPAETARALDVQPSEAKLVSNGAPLQRGFATLWLGDDLAPGRHSVEISYRGNSRAWARFWTPGRRVERERVSLWVSDEPIE